MTFAGTANLVVLQYDNDGLSDPAVFCSKVQCAQAMARPCQALYAAAGHHRVAIRISFSTATTDEALFMDLQKELLKLNEDDTIETTLLIYPNVLTDFYVYNDFLNIADDLLIDMKLEGIYQIASFHPDYQFASTEADDAENYTNRSPYPLLHLIREQSLEKAISHYPEPELIPEYNIKLMKKNR